MKAAPPNPADQISIGEELARKATHLGALIVPGGYHFLALTWVEMLCILVPVTVTMIIIDVSRLRGQPFWTRFAQRYIGMMIRSHEKAGDFTGASYILLSMCFTIALYDKTIAIAALSFIIVGDVFAALIGRVWGRHRFGNKSVEGSLACLAGCLIVAQIVPGLPLEIGIPGAVVATVTEALSTRVDDNISVPIISGLVMTLLSVVLISI